MCVCVGWGWGEGWECQPFLATLMLLFNVILTRVDLWLCLHLTTVRNITLFWKRKKIACFFFIMHDYAYIKHKTYKLSSLNKLLIKYHTIFFILYHKFSKYFKKTCTILLCLPLVICYGKAHRKKLIVGMCRYPHLYTGMKVFCSSIFTLVWDP